MIGTLAGDIAKMSLLEILTLLNSGKKTGRLSVTNNEITGEIYLQEGKIVHSFCDSNIGEQAILTMVVWLEGTFDFEADVIAPEISISKPTKQLLLEGTQIVKDFENIKKLIGGIHFTGVHTIYCVSSVFYL